MAPLNHVRVHQYGAIAGHNGSCFGRDAGPCSKCHNNPHSASRAPPPTTCIHSHTHDDIQHTGAEYLPSRCGCDAYKLGVMCGAGCRVLRPHTAQRRPPVPGVHKLATAADTYRRSRNHEAWEKLWPGSEIWQQRITQFRQQQAKQRRSALAAL